MVGAAGALLDARDRGAIVQVRRGVYLERTTFDRSTAVEQHRLRVLAVAHQRPSAVFAGFSAAVLLGLPAVGRVPSEVVVLSPTQSGRRRNGVVELVRARPQDLAVVGGVVTTSLVETLIEVARSLPLLNALTMVDAALRAPGFGGPGPRCGLGELRAAFESMARFPGCRRVSAVLERASMLSETPLETLSRVRFEELGFPTPVQQYQVRRLRSGRSARLDFAWPEHRVWGEADGGGKYLGDGAGDAAGRSATVVAHEKRREDEIRAATGWTCARWDWADAWRGAPLRGILREAGLPHA